jgi:hypothetical protein
MSPFVPCSVLIGPKRPPRRSEKSPLWAPIPAKIPASPIFPAFSMLLLCPNRPTSAKPPAAPLKKKCTFGLPHSRQKFPRVRVSRLFYVCFYALLGHIGQDALRAAQNKVHLGPPIPAKIPASPIFPAFFHVSFYALLGHIGQTARRAAQKKKSILGPHPRQNSRESDFSRLFHVSLYALLGHISQNARRAAQNKVHFGPPVPPKLPRVRFSPPFHVSFYALMGHIGQNARRAAQKKVTFASLRRPQSDCPRKNSKNSGPHAPRLLLPTFSRSAFAPLKKYRRSRGRGGNAPQGRWGATPPQGSAH